MSCMSWKCLEACCTSVGSCTWWCPAICETSINGRLPQPWPSQSVFLASREPAVPAMHDTTIDLQPHTGAYRSQLDLICSSGTHVPMHGRTCMQARALRTCTLFCKHTHANMHLHTYRTCTGPYLELQTEWGRLAGDTPLQRQGCPL